jgi:hypothetical protein
MISKNKLSKIFKELNLINYINEMNEKAQKRMDENPDVWIGKLTNDPDHWAGYGVYCISDLLNYLDAECKHNLEKEERYV